MEALYNTFFLVICAWGIFSGIVIVVILRDLDSLTKRVEYLETGFK
ncbi:MAG: hypothetical protein WC346_15160 [Methanogenium sp.]|jgi:hypothetical protein